MTCFHEPIVLACAADDFFAMPLAVTVRSALENLNQDRILHVFILDGGISNVNQEKINCSLDSKRVKIEWIKPSSSDLEKLYHLSDSTYPISAYYRLLLPNIIPHHYDKVIYLDTDLVILSDLEELWNVPFDGHYLLAAMDAANRCLSWPQHLKHLNLESMGLSGDTKYLQSGVLVIDLVKWRTQGILDELLCFISGHLNLPYPDMDALNFVLAKKWKELDPRWNQIPVVYGFSSWQESPYTEEEFFNVVNNPFIIHYGSKPKPWDYRCTHPRKSLWYEYLNKTAWAGWQDTLPKHLARLGRQATRRVRKSLNKFLFKIS